MAVGVEWADRSEQADARPLDDRDAPRNAGPDTDQATDRRRPVVLTDPERRAAEYHRHRAIVEHAVEHSSDAARGWSAAVPEFLAAWEKIRAKYGYPERGGPVAQPADGSWQGSGGRRLDHAQNKEIDQACARISEVAERAIIPGVLAVEAQDPTRRLAGFEHRFKGPDRLKEKVADLLEPPSKLTASDALHAIGDVVRFTYMYPETNYTRGVLDDVDRLKSSGFELDKLKNTWTNDQYKGINAQWVDPDSGVRFEVQFHTKASLEAKELTHMAYERIRGITEPSPETDREAAELAEFQSKVNAKVSIPPDVGVIQDYRRE